MRAPLPLLLHFLQVLPALASPVSRAGLIPSIATDSPLRPRLSVAAASVNTPLGVASGASDASGATRYAVRYATHTRWEPSTVATTWTLPNGATDPSALPKLCPQSGVDDSDFAEDCLSMILYVPPNVTPTSKVPTMLWIHGGSFIIGGATDPGLDGSALATATNAIVAVVQYRLGALGWMPPSGGTNYGLKDIVNALTFLNKVLPSFGGDPSQVTIAGQSSGATMIRGLLAVPSAASLFKSAILQSDPMDYGFLSTNVQNILQTSFTQSTNCVATDSGCLNALSLDNILDLQNDLVDNAPALSPAAGDAEPIRVVHDGTLVTSTLDSSSTFPAKTKPLLISTVLNEAGLAIYGAFNVSVPEVALESIVNATFGTSRTNELINSDAYALPPGDDASTADARAQLQTIGTDYLWKCSSWTFARSWAANGGNAYVGMYVVGASYPGNSAVPYCTSEGVVCHQDDIEIVFGTVPSPDSAQSALTTEMQARYGAFFRTGNPNPSGSSYTQWQSSGASNVGAINLGASGLAPIGTCDPSYWGEEVEYDYQVYDL